MELLVRYYVLTFECSLHLHNSPACLKRSVIKIVVSLMIALGKYLQRGPALPRSHWNYNCAYIISIKVSDMFSVLITLNNLCLELQFLGKHFPGRRRRSEPIDSFVQFESDCCRVETALI